MRFTKPNWQKIMFAFFMVITPRIVKDHFQKQIIKSKKEVPPKNIPQLDVDLIRNAEIMMSKNSYPKKVWRATDDDEFVIAIILFSQELALENYSIIEGDSIKCCNCGDLVKIAIPTNHGLKCSLCFVCVQVCDEIDKLDFDNIRLEHSSMRVSRIAERYAINRRAA